MMLNLIRAAAVVPITATLLPLLRTGRGWIRIWDFPRPQIAAFATALIALSARYRRRGATDFAIRAALAACVVYQTSKIWRYTPVYPKQVLGTARDPDSEISLLVGNVLMQNRQFSRVLAAVRDCDPDVVCLVETDRQWASGLAPLDDVYPHKHVCPLPNAYGMVLYTRLPLLACETRYLVERDVPSMHARLRLKSGRIVALHCLHPRPPLPNTSSHGRDAELVIMGAEVAKDSTPAIVAGDLNDVAWSHTTRLFQQISGTLDPRVGRGMFNSFHADYPWLRYPLDHVFHTEDFKLAELRRLRHVGSDHFPIFARLVLSPEAAAQQEPPPMTESAVEDAQEILDDASRETSR